MKKIFILFICLFICLTSVFAIEPKHRTNEELTEFAKDLEITQAVTFKIENKSDKDVSIFICKVPMEKDKSKLVDWIDAYEYIIPAKSKEEIVFVGKHSPADFFGFGWYCEDYGFGNGGLDWWAKHKPIIDKDGNLTYEESNTRKSINGKPILLEK